ncbi:MAG: SspB family protein [Hyphomicrobiaceae bacterium]
MASLGTIDYEALAQDAMRGVIRRILRETAENGLPGEHHFYISLSTRAPGVVISKRLRERYPDEMTIVLQHRFWDLVVGDERFEVKLTFDSIPERLVVPFSAIKVFFDPSVRYALQFETPSFDTGTDADAGLGARDATKPAARDGASRGGLQTRPTHGLAPVQPRPVTVFEPRSKPGTVETAGSVGLVPFDAGDVTDVSEEEVKVPSPAGPAQDPQNPTAKDTAKPTDEPAGENDAEEGKGGAVVVSLDQFRKK